MVSKSNSSKSSTADLTKPPSPQNEYFYENNALKSQRVYDPAQNGYVTKSFSTPTEQNIENQATDYIGGLVNKLPNAVNLSPESIAQYRDAYANPQINALNDSYNQAKGQATQAATSRGLQNSVGFGNYTANQLEKNRAQGLADIQANAKLQEYDLPNKILSPYVNQFNLYNAALSGQQANMAQNLEPAFQGSQAGQNALSQNYQNQLAYYNQKQQQQPQRGGLFSFFTGGV
jgi:hypothetical protein